jgi:hypothetical protein
VESQSERKLHIGKG